MKHTTLRILALVMALVLALPALVLAEDEGGVLTLPESGIELEELDLSAADDDPQEDVDVTIEVPGDGELEIPVEEPVSVVGGEPVGEQVELSGLEEPGEAAEPTPGAAEANDGALASNGWDYVDVKYIDAKGKEKGPVKCARLRGGDDPIIGNGWYAVTGDISYTVDMSVWGETNLILCDGATLTANSGIWIHKTARLTIWAQSTDVEKMGKLEAFGVSNRAGIGGIQGNVAGNIIINGGNIEAKGGSDGAGIGAGQGEGSGFTRIEINGGHVYAEGNAENHKVASGIGGTKESRTWGDVVITGGFVEARGKFGYPGIDGKNVTISGNCTVKATGNGGGAGITGNRITIDGGKITAKGSTVFKVNTYGIRVPDGGGAGIGPSSMLQARADSITINGGTVKATGGHEAAGIGSCGPYECRDITINGGTVTAKGTSAAGIGGGGHLIGTIAISGGTVDATGDDGGAGIGAGLRCDASKGKVIITGGKVTARGGAGAAGIGGGRPSGKFGGAGSNVEIGGTADVTAWAGVTKRFDLCSAIGRGHRNGNFGTLKLADNMSLRAGKSDQAAEGSEPCASDQREDACKNNWFVHIRRCDHPGATYSDLNDKTHTLDACKYCLRGSKKEAHEIDPKTGRCRRCSYAPRVEITFDGNGAPGEMDSQKLTLANRESLEYNTYIWKGHTFKEWNTRKDGSGKSFANGAVPGFTDFTGDTTLYAQWYTNVTLVSSSLQVEWDGKPHAVKGFIVMDGSQRVDADFPKVRAGAEATKAGVYPAEFTGVKLKKTTDTTDKYLVTELIVGRLTITQPEQEITPPSAVKGLVYDGTEQKLVQGGKAVGGEMRYSLDKWNWSGSIPTARNAGAYTVYYLSRGDGNHRDTKVSQLTVTIARRELTVKADMKAKLVGDPDPELTYTCAPALVKGDKLTGELTRDRGEEIGQYCIRIGTLTAGDNYKIRFEENWLVIRRRALPFPTAEPTVKPTSKPTAEPTATPTAKPTVK